MTRKLWALCCSVGLLHMPPDDEDNDDADDEDDVNADDYVALSDSYVYATR